jgi:hypothetical protein
MAKEYKRPYTCPCCGYTTTNKTDMRRHLYSNIKSCPKLLNDIELTDEIKDYILANRVYDPNKKIITTPNLLEKLGNLQIENAILKNKKDESFYQLIVEKYLGGTHSRNKNGITDVTTDKIHAEIKRWKFYKDLFFLKLFSK